MFHIGCYCGVGSEGVTLDLCNPPGHFPTFLLGGFSFLLPSLFSLSLMSAEEETPVSFTPEQRAWLLEAFGANKSHGTMDSPGDGTANTSTEPPSQDPPPPSTASSSKRLDRGIYMVCATRCLRSPARGQSARLVSDRQ